MLAVALFHEYVPTLVTRTPIRIRFPAPSATWSKLQARATEKRKAGQQRQPATEKRVALQALGSTLGERSKSLGPGDVGRGVLGHAAAEGEARLACGAEPLHVRLRGVVPRPVRLVVRREHRVDDGPPAVSLLRNLQSAEQKCV